jgi:hypothetical protein
MTFMWTLQIHYKYEPLVGEEAPGKETIPKSLLTKRKRQIQSGYFPAFKKPTIAEPSCVGNRKGHEGDIPGPFDRGCQFSLVPGTITGDPPGKNFPAFRYKMVEGFHVLIIDSHIIVGAEDTHLSALKGPLFSYRRCHVSFPSSD